MSFRRIPFQFSTTDPVERQRELEKRFGLPSRNKMHVDVANPMSMGAGLKDPSASSSSPRLQHRVPIFAEGYDQPIRSSVDSTSTASENKKSNVRVIPIEIEGAETRPSARHRTFSGPAGLANEQNEELLPPKDDASPLKRSMQDLSKPTKMKATIGPKVYNIPIKVEGAGTEGRSPKSEKAKSPVRKDSRTNGCNVSKHVNEVKSSSKEQSMEPEYSEEQKIRTKICVALALKKIENVLEELKSYKSGVQEFNGTVKDKQYRYLDEMLTRCMLRLDDIDTMGNDEIRSARKSAVKKVQACIDLLENKINALNDTAVAKNGMKDNKDSIQEVITEASEHDNNKIKDAEQTEVNNVEMVERQDIENLVPDGNKSVKSTAVIECTLSEGDTAENLNVKKTLEKLDESKVNVELLNEESKDEMREASCKGMDSDNQIHETEMTECPSAALVKPDSTNEVLPDKNVAESIEVKGLQNGVTQERDAGMKEIQNTLNDTEEKTLNCDTSQIQDQSISDINMEETTTTCVAGTEITSSVEQSVLPADC